MILSYHDLTIRSIFSVFMNTQLSLMVPFAYLLQKIKKPLNRIYQYDSPVARQQLQGSQITQKVSSRRKIQSMALQPVFFVLFSFALVCASAHNTSITSSLSELNRTCRLSRCQMCVFLNGSRQLQYFTTDLSC